MLTNPIGQYNFEEYPDLVYFLSANTPKAIISSYQKLTQYYYLSLIENPSFKERVSPLEICAAFGKLPQLNLIIEKNQDQASHFLQSNLVNALWESIKYGFLPIVIRLLEIDAVKRSVTADDNMALYISAVSEYSHIGVVKCLLDIEAVKVLAATSNNAALLGAIVSGHLDIVNCLLEINTVRYLAAVLDNRALFLALENNHPQIATRLLELDVVKNSAAVDDNNALCWAVKKGYSDVAEHLLSIDAVKALAATHNNRILRLAANNGDLNTVNRLLEIDLVKDTVTILDNAVFILAAQNGHLGIVSRLLKIDAVKKLAAAKNNGAFLGAAQNGHLSIINCLLEIDVVKQLGIEDFIEALILAEAHQHFDIAYRLLELPEVFDVVERHEEKFGVIVQLFIRRQLMILAIKKNQFGVTQPRDRFDITETEVPLYYCILRNLIRRNDWRVIEFGEYSYTNVLKNLFCRVKQLTSLLQLPSLADRLHRPMSAAVSEHELLKLALQVKNVLALQVLMMFPRIRVFAKQHNLYSTEATNAVVDVSSTGFAFFEEQHRQIRSYVRGDQMLQLNVETKPGM